MPSGGMKVEGGGEIDDWEDECFVQNDAIQGNWEKSLPTRDPAFFWKYCEGAITTETGRLFQYLKTAVSIT